MIRQDAFVIRVQAVMRSLHKIARSMPSEFSLDFGAPVLKVTRTAASLHLMLYQVSRLDASLRRDTTDTGRYSP